MMAWQNAGAGPAVGAMNAESNGVQAYTLQGLPEKQIQVVTTDFYRRDALFTK